MMQDYSTIENCRVCGGREVADVLDLGFQLLANSLKRSAEEIEGRFPLRIGFCPNCTLVQLMETVRKELLFDTYVWVTGTSSTAREYADTFRSRALAVSGAVSGDLVVEVASNDGTFLKPFLDSGLRVLGVDPAANICDMARAQGVDTLTAYFDRNVAASVAAERGHARLVIARNVIPHVSELHDVVAGMAEALAEDGTGIIEFHYGGRILSELHYDSIYHEHLCYFSVRSITELLRAHGLEPFDLDESPISGGSYVTYFSKAARPASPRLEEARAREEAEGVGELDRWLEFARRARDHRADSLRCVGQYAGRSVVGFGASARSSTYLNFCGIASDSIAAIIDNNPLKQGLFTAGSSVPIVSFEQGLSMAPDLIYVLGWNFLGEIVDQCEQAGYRGTYLVPFPGDPHFLTPKR